MFNKDKIREIRELKDRISRLEEALFRQSKVIPSGSIVEWEGNNLFTGKDKNRKMVCVRTFDKHGVDHMGRVNNYYTVQVIGEDFRKGAIMSGVNGRYLGEPIGSEKLWTDKETKLKIKEFYKDNK